MSAIWLALACSVVAGLVGGVIGTQLALFAFVRGMQDMKKREHVCTCPGPAGTPHDADCPARTPSRGTR